MPAGRDPRNRRTGGTRIETPPPDETRDRAGDARGAELARAARTGDREAFAGLYERYAPTVHGVLVSMVSVQEAHDLVQEVFLSALRSIGRLAEPERVGPWLATIARNRARDLYRSRGARGARGAAEPTVELTGELAEPAADPAPDGDDEREAARALQVVRELPEAYRETLILRLVEGLSGPEIALRTGLTHGSVRVNLHRGMKLLRERLARKGTTT